MFAKHSSAVKRTVFVL